MGTDIHFVTQKKVDGEWVDFESDIAGDRIYFWFAWLADVRNGHGFAGVKTVIPLTSKRGLPDDFTLDPERGTYAEHHNGTWMGDHSHGWATSTEILNHYRPCVQRFGVVPLQTYLDFRNGGIKPEVWSGDVGGGGVIVKNADEYDRDPDSPVTDIRMTWEDEFPIQWFIDAVEKDWLEHGEFRMVFGFDS